MSPEPFHRRRFTASKWFEHKGQFHVRANLYETYLAHLGKGSHSTVATGRTSERFVIGFRIGRVEDDAVDSDQTETTMKGSWSIRSSQRAYGGLKQISDRGHTKTLSRHAKTRAVRRGFADAQPPSVFENLTDRHVGKKRPSLARPKV